MNVTTPPRDVMPADKLAKREFPLELSDGDFNSKLGNTAFAPYRDNRPIEGRRRRIISFYIMPDTDRGKS